MNISLEQFLWKTCLTVVFALVARAARAVNTGGAVAGAMVSLTIFLLAGSPAFSALILVFLLTSAATRVGYHRKLRLGTAERKSGRTASQVLANLSVAALCAIGYGYGHDSYAFLVALAAALSEAAGDTISSELGQAFTTTSHLVTNWQTVPAGTDGGVSLAGSFCGILSAAVIGSTFALTRALPWRVLPAVVIAATVGMFADSLLGAVFERRKLLNNNAVNLTGTVTAAVAAGLYVGVTGGYGAG